LNQRGVESESVFRSAIRKISHARRWHGTVIKSLYTEIYESQSMFSTCRIQSVSVYYAILRSSGDGF